MNVFGIRATLVGDAAFDIRWQRNKLISQPTSQAAVGGEAAVWQGPWEGQLGGVGRDPPERHPRRGRRWGYRPKCAGRVHRPAACAQ